MDCDLLVTNARLPDQATLVNIACQDGKITAIDAQLAAVAAKQIDAHGNLVTAPFVDCHFHLDSTLSLAQARRNESGTLLEGIEIWGELKRRQTAAEITERALHLCRWSIAQGTLAIRSHVDVSDPQLATVEALLAVREQMQPYLDIQLVAFPQDGFLRDPQAKKNLVRALDMGVDIVGGIPHHERTTLDGAASITELFAIAAGRGLRVDMHCDENDDPLSRHVETMAQETVRHGLHGRVAGSHLTSMHSMDNYSASKLIGLLAEAQMAAIPNPLINLTLQGRYDTYPKRRGITRIPELWRAGVPIAFGHDCVLDPWYPLGSHDMLEVAHVTIHGALLTAPEQMQRCFAAVTTDAATVFGLEGYGLAVGANADLVILQAKDPVDAIRRRATRLHVIRHGNCIATTPPTQATVTLEGRHELVDFSFPEFPPLGKS